MTFFQIGAILFALFMLYVISIHGKKKTLSFAEVSFWVTTWIFFIVISIFPNWLTGISHTLRFARVFDLLLIVALMILTVLVFFGYFQQKEMALKLEQLTRELAIKNVKSLVANKKK